MCCPCTSVQLKGIPNQRRSSHSRLAAAILKRTLSSIAVRSQRLSIIDISDRVTSSKNSLPFSSYKRQFGSGCCRSRRRAELTVLATLPSVGTRADGGGMTGIESTADSDAVNAGPTAIRLVHDGLSHISPFEQVSKPYLTMLLLSARSAPWRYM